MNLPTDLQKTLDAFESGEITREQATERVKAWPAYLPCDMAAKARALRAIATAPTARGEGATYGNFCQKLDTAPTARGDRAVQFLPRRNPRPHALLRNQKP
jgi:hypothetical protein